MERDAMSELTSLLRPEDGTRLMDLYLEYEKHESPESKFTKDLDLFDFVQQAFAYEKKAAAAGASVSSLNLEKFYGEISKIAHPVVRKLADQVLADRTSFLNSLPHQAEADK
jgi:5'-deoxynucleotidase YfbR-like HD superfamily hydrolase